MQLITPLQNNSITSLCPPAAYKDSHESDATSDSSFEQQPDDSPLIFKKSLPSTHFSSCQLQEDYQEGLEECQKDLIQPCSHFFTQGYCWLGSECDHSHERQYGEGKRKRIIHNQIMANFPSVAVSCLTRRINSFLQ